MRQRTMTRTLKLLLGIVAFSLVLGLVPVGLDPAGAGGVGGLEGIAEGSTEGEGRGCGGVKTTVAPLLSADIERKWGLDWDCDGPSGDCPL